MTQFVFSYRTGYIGKNNCLAYLKKNIGLHVFFFLVLRAFISLFKCNYLTLYAIFAHCQHCECFLRF